MGMLPARRIWLTPSSFPHGVEASHLSACRGSRVCFASYLAFHFSVKSLGGARDIVLVRATVARERSMFQTMFSALLLSTVRCCDFSFSSSHPLACPLSAGRSGAGTTILEWMDRWLLWYCGIWGNGGFLISWFSSL